MFMSRYLGAIGASLLLTFIGVSFAHADTSVCSYSWNKNLKIGSTGSDVLDLQRFLNSDPDTTIALSGPGSKGKETSSYGSMTAKAIAKFQMKYAADILSPAGITKGTGSVGPATRAKLNALCNAGISSTSQASTTVQTTQNVLTVSKGDQPQSALAPAGAGGVPFTTVTLTAGASDVTVNSITVRRSGAGADGAFDSVALNDEDGSQIGDEKYFDSSHQVVFNEPITISAHTSTMLTVVGNMTDDTSDFAGQMPVLEVVAIDASAPVSGTLPIDGTAQTVNDTLVIGGAQATLSQFDPETNSNHYINDTGVRFSGIRITADSQEDLTLSSITWDQTGTAGPSDITNVTTIVNGTAYPTVVDGRSYTSTFSPGIVIPKGNSIDVYVQGDLTTTGANRTVEFDIHGSDDVALTGNTYGYGVGISAEGNTATDGHSVFITSDGDTDGDEGTPFFSGSITSINGGTLISIGK